MKWIVIVLFGLLAGCQRTETETKPAETRPVDCGLEIAQLDSVLKPGGTLVFGEFHGTVEVPRFVAAVGCRSAKRGPTVVGLEIPADPSFEAYLRGDGGGQAKRALLAGPFWVDPFQDGRRSVAAFELIEQIRRWQQAGMPIDLLLFDGHKTAERTRDEVMAETILAKRKQRPDASFVLLMGNLHARKDSDLMKLLPSPISLNVRHHPGTAWVCRTPNPDDCGPYVAPPSEGAADRQGIDLTPPPDEPFDGSFDVVSFTASPPAAFPEKAEGLDEKLRQLMSNLPR